MNKIKVLVIPVVGSAFTATVNASFQDYRRITPGWDAGTTLELCPSLTYRGISVYVDEEGLPDNPDSISDPEFRNGPNGFNKYVQRLTGHSNGGLGYWGPCLVSGEPDDEEYETAVPEEFLRRARQWIPFDDKGEI